MTIFNDVVRLRIKREEMLADYPIGVSFCDYEESDGEVNAIFTTSHLPHIGGMSEKDDTINNVLAELNRKVAQDAVKIKNMPPVMQKIETIIDNPHLNGEQDHLRSKAKEVHEVNIPAITIKEINARFDREGQKPIKGKKILDDKSHIFDFGIVDSG